MAHRSRWDDRGSDGFSMVEVLVALVVMAIILGSIAYGLGVRVLTISSQRNEQTGQGLLNKALGQVRAMPYTAVKNGLTSTPPTPTSPAIPTTPTSHIVKTPTTTKPPATQTWTFHYPGVNGTGDIVLHGGPFTPAPPAPYSPQRAKETINGVPYTVTTVPTVFTTPKCTKTNPGTPPTCTTPPIAPKTGTTTPTTGVVRVTVSVTWPGASHGSLTTLVGQTVVYSPSSFGNTTHTTKTTPFAAPYEPNFTATALAGAGSVTIRSASTPTAKTGPVQGVPRSSFTSLNVSLTGAHSYSAFIRTSSVFDWTRSTGAALVGTTSSTTGTLVSSGASSDPSSPDGTFQSHSMTSSTSDVKLKGNNGSATNTITATPSSGDTGLAVSTAAAAATQGCANLAGTDLTTSLACGSSKARQATGAKITANLYRGSDLVAGTLTLAHVEETSSPSDRTFSARYPAVTSTVTCTKTRTPWGCATAGAQMQLGKVVLGGLPTKPVKFGPDTWRTTCSLVCLTDYSAEVSSWAKSGTTVVKHPHITGTISLPAPGDPAPTLSYFTATAHKYASLTLGKTTATTITPHATFAKTVTGVGNVTVTVSATLRVNTGTFQSGLSTTSPTCTAVCTITESVGSPLTGTIQYKVTAGGTVIADFVMTVNLGSVKTRTSYQKAT